MLIKQYTIMKSKAFKLAYTLGIIEGALLVHYLIINKNLIYLAYLVLLLFAIEVVIRLFKEFKNKQHNLKQK